MIVLRKKTSFEAMIQLRHDLKMFEEQRKEKWSGWECIAFLNRRGNEQWDEKQLYLKDNYLTKSWNSSNK